MVEMEEKSQEVEYVDPSVNRVPNYEAVSYTHLDVYKRQVLR